MNKNLKKMQNLEKQYFNNEIRKIDNAEKYYKKYSLFNSLAVLFFIMSIIMIITAAVYQFMLISTNDMLVNLFIVLFMFTSLILLIISTFYNFKTMNLVEQYYSKY